VDLFDDLEGGEEERESDERWIVSYADFITTLFALFVLLFALSLEDTRLKAGIESVARMIGARPLMQGMRPDAGQGAAMRPSTVPSGVRGSLASSLSPFGQQGTVSALQPENAEVSAHLDLLQLNQVKESLEHDLSAFSDSGVSLKLTREGLIISLAAARFFKSGEAEINPAQEPVLKTVAMNIGRLKNPMRVEGFTDSIPIHNAHFVDNWDLSAERAGNVLRYLLDRTPLEPTQLSLAGYGPYRPVASNDTEDGRALNRHVDIVVRPVERLEQ